MHTALPNLPVYLESISIEVTIFERSRRMTDDNDHGFESPQ